MYHIKIAFLETVEDSEGNVVEYYMGVTTNQTKKVVVEKLTSVRLIVKLIDYFQIPHFITEGRGMKVFRYTN